MGRRIWSGLAGGRNPINRNESKTKEEFLLGTISAMRVKLRISHLKRGILLRIRHPAPPAKALLALSPLHPMESVHPLAHFGLGAVVRIKA